LSTNTSITDFDQLQLVPPLATAVAKAGYSTPRPIQAHAIPAALEGRDVLGLAQTGTGKTAAFAIPCIEHLLLRKKPGPRVLVVGPTRELVSQIDEEFKKLTRGTRLQTMTIYGGVSEKPQIQKLNRKPDVICACPGRLLDLYGQGHVDLTRIDTLILDEADHMFDMGFLPDIRRIISTLPERRQNLLFAATMPKEIRKLAEQMLIEPHVVEIDHSVPANTIEHALYPVREKRKIELLRHLLKDDGFDSAIVFTRTKRRARQLAQKLDDDGHRAVALQGNMSQNQRDRAMNGFRKRKFDILVATDIAARGIDVERVSHVINLDIPNTAEAYTHRIGRTGRSEREGKAFTFITEDDGEMIAAIEKAIGASIEIQTVPGFEEALIPTRGRKKRSGQRGRNRSDSGPPRRSHSRNRPASNSRRRSGAEGKDDSNRGDQPARKKRRRRRTSDPSSGEPRSRAVRSPQGGNSRKRSRSSSRRSRDLQGR